MSTEEPRSKLRTRDRRKWLVFTGNFYTAQEYFSEKDNFFWSMCIFLDILLRGFAQMAIANNPISGLLIVAGMSATVPDVLAVCGSAGVLGLVTSTMIRDSAQSVASGLTLFNPMLVGVVSYAQVPYVYGPFDGFSSLMLVCCIIFSVYFTRAMRGARLPALALPYLICEFLLLIILKRNCSTVEFIPNDETMGNATRNGTMEDGRHVVDVVDGLDWGMVFRGVVTSASQLFAVDDVALGSIIYLAVLIYSPIIAGLSFLGALVGTLVGVALGEPCEIIYAGIWGMPCYLTGAIVGGTYLVLNGQTAVATLAAVIFTAILQHALNIVFHEFKIPPLTLGFHVSAWLFLALGTSPEGVFFIPGGSEEQKPEIRNRRQTSMDQPTNADEPEVLIKVESKTASS